MDLDESPVVFDLLRQSVRRPSFSEAYDDDDPSENRSTMEVRLPAFIQQILRRKHRR